MTRAEQHLFHMAIAQGLTELGLPTQAFIADSQHRQNITIKLIKPHGYNRVFTAVLHYNGNFVVGIGIGRIMATFQLDDPNFFEKVAAFIKSDQDLDDYNITYDRDLIR